MWIEGILGVAGIVLIASGLIAAGRSVLQLLAPHSVRPELPHRMLAAGLGIAMLSTGILGLGMAGLLYHSVLAVLIGAVGALGAWEIIRRLRAVVAAPERPGWVAAVAVAAVALPALPYLLLPPLARDALVYHLEVPRQYLLHHGLIELPRNVYAYFPKGIEMLFTAVLGLFPPWTTQLVHFSFLALTVLAVMDYAAAVGGRSPRWLWLPAILAFASVPTLWLDATSAYIDAGLMFFIALTALGLDWHHRRGDPALLGVSLLLAGFVVAIKYTAFYFVLALLSVYLVSVLARRRTADLAWRHPVWLGAGLLVFAGPYFAWNAWHTGNPVFPFFGGLFPNSNPFWTQAQADAFWGFLASYGHPFHFPLAPALNYLVAAFNPVLHLREFFDGVLGPFLLIGVLAVLPARKRNSSEALTGCFVVVVALVWGILLRQARFLLPVLPLLLLMLIQALEGWWGERPWRRAVWVAVCLGVIAFNLAVLLPELARQPALELVSSRTTREDILNTRLPVYACQRYINRELPPDARIWTLQTGNELFYLDRAYLGDYVVEDHTFHTWLAEACEPSAITNRFAHYGVTHLLIRTDAVFAPELYTDIPDKYLVMRAFFRSQVRLCFEANGFAVLALQPSDKIDNPPPVP
ncbi:MAG: hypothetical protein GX414_13995 [Acidobacteria bacterium]|nr:hypothetical protein [Acidobacteriota bacterium]